jgi:hypothetical protein
MPSSLLGQLITLAVQVDHDPTPRQPTYVVVATKTGDTIQSIVSRLGHPENARAVADLNGVPSVLKVINHQPYVHGDLNSVRVPSRLRPSLSLSVLAGAEPPKITGGYAKFQAVDRYGRTGITQFMGYDPLIMTVPLLFEGLTRDFSTLQSVIDIDGDWFARQANIGAQRAASAQEARGRAIETDIELLERMAGRGSFVGSGIGAPPVIRASTTDANGNVVGLIPVSYQWNVGRAGMLWRIVDLAWDDGAVRNAQGDRLRASCTLTLWEHTTTSLVSQSAAARAHT